MDAVGVTWGSVSYLRIYGLEIKPSVWLVDNLLYYLSHRRLMKDIEDAAGFDMKQ